MIRNEMDRFLPRTLEVWNDFSDSIIIVDDGSTDGTKEAAEGAGACVIDAKNKRKTAWGNEAPTRKLLFETAWDFTSEGDYIFFLDADMIPARCPRPIIDSKGETFAFFLYDLWEPKKYRDDSYWAGHFHPRPWMIKRTK